MVRITKSICLLMVLLFWCSLLKASDPDLSWWDAYWIKYPGAPAYEYGVYHFRKVFDLHSVPDSFKVYISADNRYKLFVNGSYVTCGPARGDKHSWFYETVDLAEYLLQGKNVIAVMVWNMGEYRPMAQITIKTGFILQGAGPGTSFVNTDRTWKSWQNTAYHPINYRFSDPRLYWQYYVAGPMDSIRAELYPWGWESPDYDDSGWASAELIEKGAPTGISSNNGWELCPRRVPLMYYTRVQYARIRRANFPLDDHFIRLSGPTTIPAHTNGIALIDLDMLQVAYPELNFSKGKDAIIRLRYAEALFDTISERKYSIVKKHRDTLDGCKVYDYGDYIIADGGLNRSFIPLWFRSHRYLQLEITTKDEPLELNHLICYKTGYPIRFSASFKSSSPMLNQLWETCMNSLVLSAQETFISDLHWEQMQYLGDTRIQAMINLYMSNDDRLVKLALDQFNDSRQGSGLTRSRYPAYLDQTSPIFSLVWLGMIHDYWMHRADDEYICKFLPGMEQIIKWFEYRINEKDLLETQPYLDFVDWGYDDSRVRGAGGSTVHTLFYAYTLRNTADIFNYFGKKQEASEYLEIASRLNKAVNEHCFDRIKGIYADSPLKNKYSQHANILAILSGACSAEKQESLFNSIIHDASIDQASVYFRYYMALALNKAGLSGQYISLLQPWENMMNMGMKTFGEWEVNPRSECHAWSSHPAYHFLATICGIKPASPGFRKVVINPAPGNLEFVSGSIPHPLGVVSVEFTKTGNGKYHATITIPENLPADLIWKGKRIKLKSGNNSLVL